MKLRKLFLLLALAAAGISALAQNKELEDDCNCPDQRKAKEFAMIMKEIQDDDELNLKPDTAARFRGGDSLLHVYMQSRMINPAKNLQDSVKYSVLTLFYVERNGKITNVRFLTHTDQIFEREAERFMATMPRWEPAKYKNKYIRSWNLMRLHFGYPDTNAVQEEEIPEEILRAMERAKQEEEEEKIRELEEKENFHFSDETKAQFMEAKDIRNNNRRNYDYY